MMRNLLNQKWRKAWRNESGVAAVEFTLIAPIFFTMTIGIMFLSLGLYTVGSLHFAVEEGARCASVRTSCSGEAAIIAYAQSRYLGPTGMPTFSHSTAACGNAVTGSLNYEVNLGLTRFTVPLSATACFP